MCNVTDANAIRTVLFVRVFERMHESLDESMINAPQFSYLKY